MPKVHRFVPNVVALLLIPPAARGQEPPDLDSRNEIRRQLIELQQARRAALTAQAELESARRGIFPDRPTPAAQDDPFDADRPEARPTAHTSPRLEAIDAQMRVAWGKVFEVQVFGRAIGDAGAREHLARMIEPRLAEAAKAHGLSRAEIEKLRLAASGDASRYLDRCGEVRLRYEEAAGRSSLRAGSASELASLQSEFQRGPFGAGSLFAKVLAKILADREAAGGAKP